MVTKVRVFYGDREDRFEDAMFPKLQAYTTKVRWMSRPDLNKRVFGESPAAQQLRQRFPELKSAVFAHVQNLRDVTRARPFSAMLAGGRELTEAIEFQLETDSVVTHHSTVGDSEVLTADSRNIKARVRIERSTTGEVFVYVAGSSTAIDRIKVNLSYILTDRQTHQLRPYYMSPEETKEFWKHDRREKKAGTVYIWKYQNGISLVTRDTKDATRLQIGRSSFLGNSRASNTRASAYKTGQRFARMSARFHVPKLAALT